MQLKAALLLGSLCCLGVGSATPAAADTCDDLWYSRNEVYKSLGYCFKTARAIRAFGNAGCLYDVLEDVPLNRAQQRMVGDLLREERALGCPR